MTAAKKLKNQNEPPLVVRKIKAYPIPADVIRPGMPQPLKVSIVRVNTLGMQIESAQLILKVGEDVNVTFTIPIRGHEINSLMRVIKTTDSYKDLTTGQKHYVTELHFKNLDPQLNSHIREFMMTIKQKN
jgi:hypothetical protein